MHARDAEPHQNAADAEPQPRQLGAGDRIQREAGHHDRERERQAGDRGVEADADGQRHRQHADDVHRPDADAHRDRAAGEPRMAQPAVREQRDPARQVERGIGGERGDRKRERDQPKVVGAVHGLSTDRRISRVYRRVRALSVERAFPDRRGAIRAGAAWALRRRACSPRAPAAVALHAPRTDRRRADAAGRIAPVRPFIVSPRYNGIALVHLISSRHTLECTPLTPGMRISVSSRNVESPFRSAATTFST
ncbi:hypothetical protein NCF_05237 [Burkholderia pseudomallei]